MACGKSRGNTITLTNNVTKGDQPEDGVFAKRKLVCVVVVGVENGHKQYHIHACSCNEEQVLTLVIQKEWKR